MERIFDTLLGGAICLSGLASVGVIGVFALLGLRGGKASRH